MTYTADDGTQVPQGPDAFSPAAQFKAWADKSAIYHNRRIYATIAARDAETLMTQGWECYILADGTRWYYSGTAWVAGQPLPGGSVTRTGTAGSFTAGAWTALNSGSIWTPDQPALGVTYSNGMFTCITPGVYDVEGGIQMDSTVTAWLALKKNDTSASSTGAVATTTAVGVSGTTGVTTRRRVRLAASDTLIMAIFVSASAQWSNTNLPGSFFGVRYVEPLR